ncbi:DinI-like family protein [Volucribacter amazonae]|uniref:DinI family protein n=1 Tax=Volucribacter amazonae TaxID=256731 RepID=A0A9X4SI09_9PAST|nr:DinI-like family protein [Volucribacter amazonae]MDG6895095.1 DinI family protein [Volucribacter amazonae]
MKKIDIRFAKERDSKKAIMQDKVIARLQQVLPERIATKFDDVYVRIRISTSQGFDLSGFSSTEKEKMLEFLEEIWNDSTILDDLFED